MSNGIASPPRAVWQYQTRDSGRWVTLFTLATFGRYGAAQCSPVRVNRATIARRSGQEPETVKTHLRKLKAGGDLSKQGRSFVFGLQHSDWPESVRPPASPPPSLMAAKIPAHVKRVSIGAWSFADYDVADTTVEVWPTIAELAERTGQTSRAVKDQLAAAADLGVIERVDGVLRVNGTPANPEQTPANPAASEPTPAVSEPSPAASEPEPRPPANPHNLQQLAHDTASVLPLFSGSAADVAGVTDASALPIADQVRKLHEAWNTARINAAKAHGKRAQPLKLTPNRARDIRTALSDHGFDVCEKALAFRAKGWLDDAGAFEKFSLYPWTERSVSAAISCMAREANPTPTRGEKVSAGIGARARLLSRRIEQ